MAKVKEQKYQEAVARNIAHAEKQMVSGKDTKESAKLKRLCVAFLSGSVQPLRVHLGVKKDDDSFDLTLNKLAKK